jgi:hypothetical protein
VLALLWAAAAGFPVAHHKVTVGTKITWIGAQLEDCPDTVRVSIPASKAVSLLERCRSINAGEVVQVRELRSFCGALSFVAGLVIHIRPFLSTGWAALAEAGSRSTASDGHSQGACAAGARRRRLPPNLVHVKQVRHALVWVGAFLAGVVGTIRRDYPVWPPPAHTHLLAAVDASPWGIGGVLLSGGTPVAWFADTITDLDLSRFNAKRGESAWNTLWEAIALLVALRLWLATRQSAEITVRSDSLAALFMVIKMSSSSPGLNAVAREIALESSEMLYRVHLLEHTPGLANYLPDRLSRLWAPEAATWPAELSGVNEVRVPIRDATFWRTFRMPNSGSAQ